MRRDPARLIIDANILVSALLGKSFPLLLALYEAGVRLFAPVQQLAETRATLTRVSEVTDAWADAQMERLLVLLLPLHPALVAPEEERARPRLGPRGQSDWPVLAAALALDAGIWSNDRDFFGVGVPVWSTHTIRHISAAWENENA